MKESKLARANERIAEHVVQGYKKIEDGVVDGYKRVERGAVDGFQKVSDAFVERFFTREGESVEEARARMAGEQARREQDR